MTIKDDILKACKAWIKNKSYIGKYAMTDSNNIWMVHENNYLLVLACDPLRRVAFGVVPSCGNLPAHRDIINTAMCLFKNGVMPTVRINNAYFGIELGIWASGVVYWGLDYGKPFPLTGEDYAPLQIQATGYGQYMVDEVKKSKAELAKIYACMGVKTYNSILMEGCVKEEPLSPEITFMA